MLIRSLKDSIRFLCGSFPNFPVGLPIPEDVDYEGENENYQEVLRHLKNTESKAGSGRQDNLVDSIIYLLDLLVDESLTNARDLLCVDNEDNRYSFATLAFNICLRSIKFYEFNLENDLKILPDTEIPIEQLLRFLVKENAVNYSWFNLSILDALLYLVDKRLFFVVPDVFKVLTGIGKAIQQKEVFISEFFVRELGTDLKFREAVSKLLNTSSVIANSTLGFLLNIVSQDHKLLSVVPDMVDMLIRIGTVVKEKAVTISEPFLRRWAENSEFRQKVNEFFNPEKFSGTTIVPEKTFERMQKILAMDGDPNAVEQLLKESDGFFKMASGAASSVFSMLSPRSNGFSNGSTAPKNLALKSSSSGSDSDSDLESDDDERTKTGSQKKQAQIRPGNVNPLDLGSISSGGVASNIPNAGGLTGPQSTRQNGSSLSPKSSATTTQPQSARGDDPKAGLFARFGGGKSWGSGLSFSKHRSRTSSLPPESPANGLPIDKAATAPGVHTVLGGSILSLEERQNGWEEVSLLEEGGIDSLDASNFAITPETPRPQTSVPSSPRSDQVVTTPPSSPKGQKSDSFSPRSPVSPLARAASSGASFGVKSTRRFWRAQETLESKMRAIVRSLLISKVVVPIPEKVTVASAYIKLSGNTANKVVSQLKGLEGADQSWKLILAKAFYYLTQYIDKAIWFEVMQPSILESEVTIDTDRKHIEPFVITFCRAINCMAAKQQLNLIHWRQLSQCPEKIVPLVLAGKLDTHKDWLKLMALKRLAQSQERNFFIVGNDLDWTKDITKWDLFIQESGIIAYLIDAKKLTTEEEWITLLAFEEFFREKNINFFKVCEFLNDAYVSNWPEIFFSLFKQDLPEKDLFDLIELCSEIIALYENSKIFDLPSVLTGLVRVNKLSSVQDWLNLIRLEKKFAESGVDLFKIFKYLEEVNISDWPIILLPIVSDKLNEEDLEQKLEHDLLTRLCVNIAILYEQKALNVDNFASICAYYNRVEELKSIMLKAVDDLVRVESSPAPNPF